MDFRELNYILAIAKHQNLTKAADSLYVGQPTLSKFLKTIEAELGQKLFQKLGNKYTLTYAGERYIAAAEEILRRKKDLDAELDDIIKRDVGVLKVAFPTMRCTYMLPYTLPAFQKLHPNVKVQVHEGHSDVLDNKILSGEAEIAFYNQRSNVGNSMIEYEVLAQEELLICTCKDHQLGKFAKPNNNSKYPKLDLALLKGERLIQLLPTQRTRQVSDEYLQQEGIRFENTLSTSNMPALMELVALGYGVAFIFEPHVRHRTVGKSIDCYSFGESRTLGNFVAAYRKESYISSYARDFIELVRNMYGVKQSISGVKKGRKGVN